MLHMPCVSRLGTPDLQLMRPQRQMQRWLCQGVLRRNVLSTSSAAGESCLPYQPENHVPRCLKVLAALSVGLFVLFPRNAQQLRADEPNGVTAIDILLDPDATMIKNAEIANERLLKSYPNGFTLDKTHQPHITILQRFVKTADLGKVYDAVGKVLSEVKPTGWKLKAYKYYYIPLNEIGFAGIVIEPTGDLIRLQEKLIDAVAPFTEKTGTAASFVITKEDPDIGQSTIDYVANYVPNASGQNFNPHVTIGIATQDYLKKMLAEKFEAFNFSPAGVSVYHLGNFGTARKKLMGWELKP